MAAKRCMAIGAVRLFLLAILGVGWVWGVTEAAGETAFETPALSEVVLFGMQPPASLHAARYPGDRRGCVKAYLDSIPPSSSLRRWATPPDPEKAPIARRANLAEQIVVLLGEKVRGEAQAFAAAVPLPAEWEGRSEGPLMEADFAGQWIDRNPGTPIAAFLHLFMAHRFRAGCEAARAERLPELGPQLAARYRYALDRAKISANPLVSCIARDLEAQSRVYLEGQGCP